MRSQPGSLGQGKGWERSMQGQGHAWAQPASRASHVGESVALAQRLVLLGVERLPFQVGLADLGRRVQAVSGVPGVPSHTQPQLSSCSAPASCRHQGAAGSEAPAQSEVGKHSWTQRPRYSPLQPPASTRGEKDEADAWLTAQTKQVSCQLNPSASRNRSPASILKSQPRHLVPNIFS